MIIEGGKELFDNGTGNPKNDLECDEISSLLAWKMVYVSCRSFRSGVPGVKGLVDRKIGPVDLTPTRI
jgi:hypothetical protein